MPSTSTSETAASRPSFGRRLWADASGSRRLLTAAAILHVALALGLHGAGRVQVAPGLIDADGIMSSFAFDSYEYQSGAARLAVVLKEDGVLAWAGEQKPLHTRLLSILFALLGPLSGYGTLSAEPFNLTCYLAVVWLTLLLGREVGGRAPACSLRGRSRCGRLSCCTRCNYSKTRSSSPVRSRSCWA